MSVPTGTYRLQLTPTFGFDAARALVPYLTRLGISHLYLSPVMQARPDSQHGYDGLDPTKVSETLGGEASFRALAEAGLPLILDIVPNHLAADDRNPWWADEDLRRQFFDIDPYDGRHRRFFLVDELAGVRQDVPAVFAATHAKIIDLVREGLVDGLRIDHVDGLADPAGYLRRLADEVSVPLWVEKILHPDERLRPWATAGTTGYDFLADLDAVSNDPGAEGPITDLYRELTGECRPYAEASTDARREQAANGFAPEVERLRRLVDDPGVAEALASLPIYRTYVEPWSGTVTDEDRAALAIAGIGDDLRRILGLDQPGHPEFVTRFQQTSPAVMAKGNEDTAFYRFHRLLALNEVGNDPGRFSISVDAFHAANAERLERFPQALLASTTHDTKRSADVRARLSAITQLGPRFDEAMREWFALTEHLVMTGGPDANTRWFVFQTLLGAGFLAPERLDAYLVKAMREAGVHTRWADPDEDWERTLLDFVAALRHDEPFLRSFRPIAEACAMRGARLTVAQTLLRATCPGIPDTYQGDEAPYLALVDPDNRRPVDWAARSAALARVGGSGPVRAGDRKLHVLHRALVERRRTPAPFEQDSIALEAGPSTVAFLRGRGEIAVIAPLRPSAGAKVSLPAGSWHDLLGAGQVAGGCHSIDDLVGRHGVAFLRRSR